MGKHKEWRKLAKKARRKRIRQKLAQLRHEAEEDERLRREQSPNYAAWLEEQKKAEEYQMQEEALQVAKAEERWLKAEEEAQKHWRELQSKLALVQIERAKQAALIKEEWEKEQRKLKELKKKKALEQEKRQKQQAELQKQVNDFIEHGGEVPEGMKIKFETNPNKPVCPFFQKTGACRFRDTCSRNHIRPGISRVLLIPNFYAHYSLQQTDNEHGSDFSLEFENQETYDHFKEFFYDVLPEMETCGHIRQFKVCCNQEIHLRGNVYVEYSTHQEAACGYRKFQGRWYGGKQLNVEFCDVKSWKSAICGLFAKQKCPKGSSCNFLHVFINPGNMFSNADKDLHHTPVHEFEDDNTESSNPRNWRWSESPERIPSLKNHRHRTSSHKKGHRHDRSRKSSKEEKGRSIPRSQKSKTYHSKHKRSRSRSPIRSKSSSRKK